MVSNWEYNEYDKSASDALDAFLPAAIFDVHAHLYRVSDLNIQRTGLLGEGPEEVGVAAWREHAGRQIGLHRLTGGLFFPMPTPACNIDRANDFLFCQLAMAENCRGLILVSPKDSPEKVAKDLGRDQVAGFKPYHVFSGAGDSFQSEITSYLPEWVWQMADGRGAVIMLHLVRDKALMDPGNQKVIQRMCSRYPGVKLVLAHAGRGFNGLNTVYGVDALRELTNIWFDTSGICESAALKAIIKAFGPRRLMWGSDFPISEIRGRCVSIGDGFIWLQNDTVVWDKISPACHPILVGLESLRAVNEAAEDLRLSKKDLQDIFCSNALNLLGVG